MRFLKVFFIILCFELSFLSYMVFFNEVVDYTKFNAIENNTPLESYAKYANGVSLYEAPLGVKIDLLLKSPNPTEFNKNYAGYYSRKGGFIKIDAGKYVVVPHELGHHWINKNMTENDVMKFCSNTNWTSWSYDNRCQEGFADLFGASITIEKELGLNWKLEEGMLYIENKRVFSKNLKNDKQTEALMEEYRA